MLSSTKFLPTSHSLTISLTFFFSFFLFNYVGFRLSDEFRKEKLAGIVNSDITAEECHTLIRQVFPSLCIRDSSLKLIIFITFCPFHGIIAI